MIELDVFNQADIQEVISTVKEFRTLDDILIDEKITYDVPIARPQKILCIGRNYSEHAKELGNEAPSEPIFFAKMPSSMLPHEGTIMIPHNVGRVDHEIELAVIIGKTTKHVPVIQAHEMIAGYTIVNDVTARAMQKGDIERKQPWLRSKSFDTFCPIGPYLIPAEVIGNPQNLQLTLRVNGEIRQQSNTANMIFPVDELIAYISRHMTLLPGDIIATGTPEGISPIQSGDQVTAEVESIGTLINSVH
ncbi:fumarylacetoacetate hydrolase family protein [candidate division KSB1 bacterium]|nr:fumarylacetoacetate hydrolase family protein [candidate division KSB1 bacterium]